MIADVTHYTITEGGIWMEWPFQKGIKPSNPQLLAWEGGKSHFLWTDNSRGVAIRLHSLKLSDGAEWDARNGFRNPEWRRDH
jgi:hypothetical protein